MQLTWNFGEILIVMAILLPLFRRIPQLVHEIGNAGIGHLAFMKLTFR